MLIPRVIPCLLLNNGVFVKTRRFQNPDYVGDPVNVINLFNRFEVDEIVLLEIRATVEGREPDYALLEQLAGECWVPLAYGGGISRLDQIQRILNIGVEKVILNTAAARNPDLVTQAAGQFGSQAVVVSMDVKKPFWGQPDVWIQSGTRRLKSAPVAYARQAEALGAGEILLTSIDREGTMAGYDLDLIRLVAQAVTIPVVACGGAGYREDLPKPLHEAHAAAVAAGSLFVYQNQERGVLINFPERPILEALVHTKSC